MQGSRQFKNFQCYLLSSACFETLKKQCALGLAIETNCESYLDARLDLLQKQLSAVEKLASIDKLPYATITSAGRLKITPLDNTVPEEAEVLMRQVYGLLPRLKITELLMEVDNWTNFTSHFKHLKTGMIAEDRKLLLTVILADAINLGLSKMSESCPGTTYAKLTWLQAWYIRDETYSSGLAELVNAQFNQSFAAHWGTGATSSSDGQNFKAGSQGECSGQVNLKYGQKPGVQFYTHISDQYAPFHTKVISATVRDATHVLDGLLYHESDLRIEEHYTDTAGFTDHVTELRKRVQIGLNKGEAKNALARAVFMNRLGEIRDRSFENQRYRASGLNIVVAAIILWNTVYLERAIQALRDSGYNINPELLSHLSPLGWVHINLTGDYIWQQHKMVKQGKFRILRPISCP